jgi:ornithine carbamoyltransferase
VSHELSKVKKSLKGRDFISLNDFTEAELYQFLDTAADLKEKVKRGVPHEILKGKTLAEIFEWPSTRTRTSFEAGIQQLGGHGIYYSKQAYWSKSGEAIKDSAQVLSRYVHGIAWRSFSHEDILEMAKWASIPVINANSDFEHPCQVLADFMTTREKKGKLKGTKTVIMWTYADFPAPIGIVNSSMFAGSKLGMDIVLSYPEDYGPEKKVFDAAQENAEKSGASITVNPDYREALKDADVIHIKTWAKPEDYRRGFDDYKPPHVLKPEKYNHWKLTQELVDIAKKDVIIQHALPVVRGVQATDAVLDGPNSVIYDEAENRLHTQKSVMALTM